MPLFEKQDSLDNILYLDFDGTLTSTQGRHVINTALNKKLKNNFSNLLQMSHINAMKSGVFYAPVTHLKYSFTPCHVRLTAFFRVSATI